MKVLFLDIDGVLASTASCLALGGWPHDLTAEHLSQFDPVALGLVRRLCEAAEVGIVLSSAWRILHDWRDVGKTLDLPIFDRTPSLPANRGAEIQHWLDAHKGGIEMYAIVDDDSDMLDSQLPCFVHCNGEDGLRLAEYRKLCKLFGVNEYDGPMAHAQRTRILQKAKLDWAEPEALGAP